MEIIQPLIIGLLGGFHCMGMCGPIAVSMPLKEHSWGTRLTSAVLYNSGRVVTYAFLGFIFGLLGFGLHMWGIQQWVSIAMGTLMILTVAIPVLFRGKGLNRFMDRIFSGFSLFFGRYLGRKTYSSVGIVGLLTGFLPCGLVYIALAGALVTETPLAGAFYMTLFGLGTMPALMLLMVAGNLVGSALRRKVQSLIPFLVLLVGILFLLRGMNLGIPYLSPKMDIPRKVQTEQFQKPECCH